MSRLFLQRLAIISAVALMASCDDPLSPYASPKDTVHFDKVAAAGRIHAATGEAEIVFYNESKEAVTLQLGGCEARLVVLNSSLQVLFDSYKGGCDDYLQEITVDAGSSIAVRRTIAEPGELDEFAGSGTMSVLVVQPSGFAAANLRAPIVPSGE